MNATNPTDPAAENAELRQRIAVLERESAPRPDEAIIKDKMAAGLTREQAQASARNQAAFTARFANRTPTALK